MSAGRWIALAAVGLASTTATLVAFAPASLADLAVARASLGRVRLAEADGSVWTGSARLVLTDTAPRDAVAASAQGAGALAQGAGALAQGAGALAQVGAGASPRGVTEETLRGFTLPGRVRWQLRPLPLLFGLVDATVGIDGAGAPVRIGGQPADLRIGAGALSLPEVGLSRLGSPWNTIRPTSALSLRWSSIAVRQGVLDGRVELDLGDVGSAITPVRPLGSYRIEVRGDGREVGLALSTLSGALRLEGQGGWDRRQGLRFEAQARAAGDSRAKLEPLLALIGRRDGDRTVIRIGG